MADKTRVRVDPKRRKRKRKRGKGNSIKKSGSKRVNSITRARSHAVRAGTRGFRAAARVPRPLPRASRLVAAECAPDRRFSV